MRIGKAAPLWCARTRGVHPSRRAPHARSTRWEFRLSCRVEPFAASYAATSARTATGRMGRVRDSISRRGEGMGSLECRRAAPQWRRFRQGSVPGDAGGPSAFHFNEQVHRYLVHNYSDFLILPYCMADKRRHSFLPVVC